MKKITSVFMLVSFCMMVNAQNAKNGKSQVDETFYIYSPTFNMVLEADNATSELSFAQLNRDSKNQLFVFSKYMDDWDIIYNLESNNYFVKKGNQIGLGGIGEWEKIKIKDGVFYIEHEGQERKLMVSNNTENSGSSSRSNTRSNTRSNSRSKGSRSNTTREKELLLGIDLTNSSSTTFFELYAPDQFRQLAVKIRESGGSIESGKSGKRETTTPPPKRKVIPKPAINSISCPASGKTIKKSTTSFSAVVANVSSRNQIRLTVNNKNIPFQFKKNMLVANNIPLSKGTNSIALRVTTSGGSISASRTVYYQPPPAFGSVYVSLHLKKNNQKCGKGDYMVNLINKITGKYHSIKLKNCRGSKEGIPVGNYDVEFKYMGEIDPRYAENSENGYSYLNTNCQTSIKVKARQRNTITCSTR